MRAGPDCAYCLMRAFITKLDYATKDPGQQEEIVREFSKYLAEHFSLDKDENVYSDIAFNMDKIMKRISGNEKAFDKVKHEASLNARKITSKLPPSSDMSLEKAFKVSLAGNAFDTAHISLEDAPKQAREVIEGELDVDELEKAVKLVEKYGEIVFISDNAGEQFFDLVLLKKLKFMGKKVTYIARENPIVNDLTVEEAIKSGVSKYAEVKGYPNLGYSLHQEDEGKLFIAKGQAAFVTMTAFRPESIIYVLKVKCVRIAEALGTRVGASVVKVGGVRD